MFIRNLFGKTTKQESTTFNQEVEKKDEQEIKSLVNQIKETEAKQETVSVKEEVKVEEVKPKEEIKTQAPVNKVVEKPVAVLAAKKVDTTYNATKTTKEVEYITVNEFEGKDVAHLENEKGLFKYASMRKAPKANMYLIEDEADVMFVRDHVQTIMKLMNKQIKASKLIEITKGQIFFDVMENRDFSYLSMDVFTPKGRAKKAPYVVNLVTVPNVKNYDEGNKVFENAPVGKLFFDASLNLVKAELTVWDRGVSNVYKLGLEDGKLVILQVSTVSKVKGSSKKDTKVVYTYVKPKAPAKKGAGRPKKAAATTTTAKKGPGRPKKADAATTTTAKKGPGRPKKAATATTTTAKKGPGRPKKAATATTTTAKKGPGRPKKADAVTTTTAKKGPGRPKKADAVTTTTAKKGPGRPKKDA